MNYPLISEYIEAIKSAEDNFEELSYLRPVWGDDGLPVMTSGNFAVVFKMRDEQSGKFYAVKCFTKEQEGRAEAYREIAKELKDVSSLYLVSIQYLEKELFVDTDQSAETEFPVLLMDWVEGKILDKYLRENLDDKYALEMLAYRFSQLAQWLIPQPFAHGDLKPDNILVREDGTLVLVDYDGMYVPAMRGQKARELGSPDFRHPLRTENDFDEHIDDFPLISILLSLKAISLLPELLEQYGAKDRLLFSEKDYRNLSESRVLEALRPLMQDLELTSLYSLFILAISQNNLSLVSSRLFNLSRPNRIQFEDENLSTEVTIEDLACAWTDEYGAKYSEDRKRLLQAPEKLTNYSIRKGTLVICHSAFYRKDLISIYIPDSVTRIGERAFSRCESLTSIHIPDSVTRIGERAFSRCESLTSIHIPNRVIDIGEGAFSDCKSLISIHIPDSVTYIGERVFSGCASLISVHIPDGVTSIGNSAFGDCKSLTSIHISESVTSIGDSVFWGCESLTSIHIPDSVTSIGNKAFSVCKSLTSIHIPDSVTYIGEGAFSDCKSLISIHIPDSVTCIGERAVFFGCAIIGDDAFASCASLTSIIIPNGTRKRFEKMLPHYKDKLVEQEEFHKVSTEVMDEDVANAWIDEYGVKYSADKKKLLGCPIEENIRGSYIWKKGSLKGSYKVLQGTLFICDKAFFNCTELTTVYLPNSVKKIGNSSFAYCSKLVTLKLNDGLMEIGNEAFKNCKSLRHVLIPRSLISVGNRIFEESGVQYILSFKGDKKRIQSLFPHHKDIIEELPY